MAWESLKKNLLVELAGLIDHRAETADRELLHDLAGAFYGRFPADDMRDRAVENMYGCLYGLLSGMREWPEPQPEVKIFNPEIQSHGWESKYTVLTVHCRGVPFTTASVRGELNRRNLRIHAIVSTNIVTSRDEEGTLLSISERPNTDGADAYNEAILYFEIGRHSRPEELEELRASLLAILREVELVVDDFPAMCERLHEVAAIIDCSDCVPDDYRDEAIAFLQWLENDHMTILGYERLEVDHSGPELQVSSPQASRLGILRLHETSGCPDLGADLHEYYLDDLHHKQLSFAKSGLRSRVHRLTYPDFVEIKEFDEEGQVIRQHRFLGLFTSSVYTMNPEQIPILRRKVEKIMAMTGLDSAEHESRELMRVLELFPRDELFQSSSEQLYHTVNSVNRIQERRQTRLFLRRDPHDKFINCLVYIPRDRYTTEQREKIEYILTEAFGATESEFTTHFSESILVRCHFVLRLDKSKKLEFDVNEIEGQIIQATLAWEDRLRLRLIEEFGEEAGEQYFRDLGAGFPPGYRDDFDPRVAVLDVRKMLQLGRGEELAMSLYHLVEEEDEKLRLRLYNRDSSLPLSDVLPILENLGLRVVTERPYEVRDRSGQVFWIQDFTLIYRLSQDIVLADIKEEFEDAFARIWFGEAESDSFNRLLIGTRLSWRELALLRAYARYLRQVLFPYSVDYIAGTMANHLDIAGGIVELFLTRFSPVFDGDEAWRQQREAEVEQRILDALEEVQNLGEDRIIRQYVKVIKATQRTNFFQEDARGDLKPYFSFKLRPGEIPDVPKPVPLFEIYVYSPRVEGVHLRGGKVARGGLRWSDREEDFRTEVLGLVKAQQVKNAVIVPVGAKGGFVARRLAPTMSREEVQAEGIECYKQFIRGLLDITDNRGEVGVVRPAHVVCKDEEDPYLVVAADKGTATFSDIANGLSQEYGFWLGDAFASGGSAGYDHKKMGITARGAWVSVQRHFREIGIDIQSTDFSVVGVGDMGGDVFGNGMLLSRHIRLLAAFNHMHIFVDPEPEAATSFEERQRLFDLPRSSWGDYDSSLISEGGGVFSRAAKSIPISPQMRERFDIDRETLTPNELISHLLRSRVDLFWNGGIGTYVKASEETHTQVGDKANDSLRVDATELRCKVIGEGGNLGVTQLGRVEFCLHGGRCNTDFIDNAGGVDCSDHEVNIKILLNSVVAAGDLTMKHRDQLLEDMTDSVADLVLQNNYHQTQAISLVEYQAQDRSGEYQRFIEVMETAGWLNRALEFIPSEEELAERRAKGKPLTRPELSVLVSYSKGVLKEKLFESDLGADPYLANAVKTAFPQRLTEEYSEEILDHRLHREIMATQIANDIVNRMGLNFTLRQQKATGAQVADIARAYTAVLEIFGLKDFWHKIEALDFSVDAGVQLDMMLKLITLVKRSTRWLLRNRRHQLAPTDLIAEFGGTLEKLAEVFPEALRGDAADSFYELRDHYIEAGVPEDLAQTVAGSRHGYTVFGIVQAVAETGAPIQDVARLYFLMGERLELDWFSSQILSSNVNNEWQALARDTYLEDLEWQQRTLAVGALRHLQDDGNLLECMESWETAEALLLERWQEMLVELHASPAPDFAMFAVANRELLDLAQSSMRDKR